MLHIILTSAADRSGPFALSLKRGNYVVGRDPKCDIILLDSSVSRRHARLTVDESAISIVDLGSRNGTFVNDEAIEKCEVRTGHVIRFGAMPYRIVVLDNQSLIPECDDETAKRSSADKGSDVDLLTPAQRRVYELLLDGISEGDIGAKLNLSVHTVHTHAKALYSQFGVHSRAELLARQFKSLRKP